MKQQNPAANLLPAFLLALLGAGAVSGGSNLVSLTSHLSFETNAYVYIILVVMIFFLFIAGLTLIAGTFYFLHKELLVWAGGSSNPD